MFWLDVMFFVSNFQHESLTSYHTRIAFFLTKGFCVNVFSSFDLATYKYKLSGRGDVIFLFILIQDHDVSWVNQQEAVVSWAAQ